MPIQYKIDWGPGYRIYLARDGRDLLILLGGGTKKRQQQDINRAVELWGEYEQPQGGGEETGEVTGDERMALTRDFKTTVQARAKRDPAFTQALLDESAILGALGRKLKLRISARVVSA